MIRQSQKLMNQSRRIQRGFKPHQHWAPALENVRIVLVGITHPGNIGAIARVMKNVGLKNLTLVSSTNCGPETEAFAMASGAYDIVEQARKLDDLEAGLKDCAMAMGTSARVGGKRSDAKTPEDLVPEFLECARSGPVACVFGRESKGLSNEELNLCTHHLIIPTDAEFASMNISHAAAVIGYEIFRRSCVPTGFQARRTRPAEVESRERMYEHIQDVLVRAGFLRSAEALDMMRDLRRILNSAQMDERDVKIVRGMFRKIGNRIRILEQESNGAEASRITEDRSDA